MMEVIRLSDLSAQECKHKYITQNDDGWYVCQSCAEELRYNPNKPPIKVADLYFAKAQRAKMNSRIKNISKWLDNYNLPFEDELLVEFSSFINEYTGLYPHRKNLISKDYILYQMLWRRGYDVSRLLVKLPKMKKTLIQNETICRTIFEALNWTWPQL